MQHEIIEIKGDLPLLPAMLWRVNKLYRPDATFYRVELCDDGVLVATSFVVEAGDVVEILATEVRHDMRRQGYGHAIKCAIAQRWSNATWEGALASAGWHQRLVNEGVAVRTGPDAYRFAASHQSS